MNNFYFCLGIEEACKPDPILLEQIRWCPKHVLKMVELEDVIT